MNSEEVEHKWFEELYMTYSRELFWIAMAYSNNRILAEDAVQEAYLYVWKNRKKLNRDKGLRFYLQMAVKNYTIDFLRQQQVHQKHHPLIQEDALDREYNPAEDDFEEKMEAAKKLLDTLPEGCKKIFVMAIIEGMTYEQIANELNISKNTVKMQMKIAYKKLQSNAPKIYLLIFILLKSKIFTPLF